jgi:hypothetical protein
MARTARADSWAPRPQRTRPAPVPIWPVSLPSAHRSRLFRLLDAANATSAAVRLFSSNFPPLPVVRCRTSVRWKAPYGGCSCGGNLHEFPVPRLSLGRGPPGFVQGPHSLCPERGYIVAAIRTRSMDACDDSMLREIQGRPKIAIEHHALVPGEAGEAMRGVRELSKR